MKTMLFNPYSGKPRHPLDIASDPQGILMVDPDEPLLAARETRGDGWFLDRSRLNAPMQVTIEKLIAHAKRARWTNAIVRKDSVETLYEADWIKWLTSTTKEKP